MASRPRAAAGRKRSVSALSRTAHHEAGHAVLTEAIANAARYVTLKPDGTRRGHMVARPSTRPSSRIQVFLAGYAAEHLLTGRRSRELDKQIGFALVARLDPALAGAFAAELSERDGYRAVEEVLSISGSLTDDEVRAEVDRYYDVARECLAALWPAVVALAKALLKAGELDRDGIDRALGEFDLLGIGMAVQVANGFLLPPAMSPGDTV